MLIFPCTYSMNCGDMAASWILNRLFIMFISVSGRYIHCDYFLYQFESTELMSII